MLFRFQATFLTGLLLAPGIVMAQWSAGGIAPGLDPQFPATLTGSVETITLTAPDLQRIRQEDDAYDIQSRFAAPIATDISPENSGSWSEMPDGRRLWRCQIELPGALASVLLFDQFRLPAGAQFFAYSADGQRQFGAYTLQSCQESGRFTIGPIPGNTVILEYVADATQIGQIRLNRVDYAYHYGALIAGDPTLADDFGDALACHVNINCPEATNWQTEKKGIARILMVFASGTAWCSGSLIGNTEGTGVPYFLTAHHCQILTTSPQFDQWAFHFDYESPTCTNPTTEPAFKSVLGCERMAFRAETDVMLLRLNPIPGSYGVYFNGWSRENTPATTSSFIHHPWGDIKKYSREDQVATTNTTTINWGPGFGTSQINTHWKVVPDIGVFEPGSSGCPLFDQNKRIVGQLHGGNIANCTVTASYFGMFHLSWDPGVLGAPRLRDWLDPAGTNPMTLNGYTQPPEPLKIEGQIKTWWNAPLVGVDLVISGGVADTVTTDTAGRYKFEDLTPGLTYSITPLDRGDDLNGLTTFDLSLINRHILGSLPFSSPWEIIAADVNLSETLTVFDIVEARKVILGIYSEFPQAPSWKYFPATLTFANPANPFIPELPSPTITIQNLQQNITQLDYIAVKTGDPNANASPD